MFVRSGAPRSFSEVGLSKCFMYIFYKAKKGKRLSQEKLARLADVANNTIIKIEAGKNQNPTLDTLKKIAKALEVSVDNLIN